MTALTAVAPVPPTVAPPLPSRRRPIPLTPDGWVCPCGLVCLTVTHLASHRQVAHGIARARTYAALGCAG